MLSDGGKLLKCPGFPVALENLENIESEQKIRKKVVEFEK